MRLKTTNKKRRQEDKMLEVFDVQRLRNLTTGILHTRCEDIYLDIERLTGQAYLTHQLLAAHRALVPYLRRRVPGEHFEGGYRPEARGRIAVEPLGMDEREEYVKAVLKGLLEFWRSGPGESKSMVVAAMSEEAVE